MRRIVGGSGSRNVFTQPIATLDAKGLQDFYKDLTAAYNKYVACGQAIGRWHGEGGLFTRTLANAGKAMIKDVIDQDFSVPGAIPNRDRSPEIDDLNTAISGYGLPWKLHANVYANVIAQRMGKGYTIGLDKRMRVNPGSFSYADKSRKQRKLRIEEYAVLLEYGTKWVNANPLFGPVFSYMAQQVCPEIAKLASKSIKRVAETYKVQKVSSKYASGTNVRGGLSSYSENAAKGMDPNNDFSSKPVEAVFMDTVVSERGGANSGTGLGGKGTKYYDNQSRHYGGKDVADLKQGLKRMTGANSSEIDDWIKNNPEFNDMPL